MEIIYTISNVCKSSYDINIIDIYLDVKMINNLYMCMCALVINNTYTIGFSKSNMKLSFKINNTNSAND